jgi:hypothetical protein
MECSSLVVFCLNRGVPNNLEQIFWFNWIDLCLFDIGLFASFDRKVQKDIYIYACGPYNAISIFNAQTSIKT